MQPSIEEWRKLYEAAIAFRDAAPGEWGSEEQVFGVQDPERGEIGYCCVMGGLGEHFALAVYLGSEGLDGLWQMRTAGPGMFEEPVEVMVLQFCLMASFEDRAQLQKQDLELIKTLGLKFRGRNQWPQFRSYRPGYLPWFLTAPEARFLTLCLRQSLEMAGRLWENPRLLPRQTRRGKYLVRVPERQGDAWVWKDTLQAPAPLRRPEAVTTPPLDEARLRGLRETLPATTGVVEMDCSYMPSGIKGEEDERPYYPQLILAADAASGFILTTEIVKPGEAPAALVEQTLEIMERMGMRPDRIEVRSEETAAILKPVGARLDIRIARVRRLPAIASARRELAAFLTR